MYSKILIPYDKSESSKRALDIAIKLATVGKSDIVISNVIDEIPLPPTLDSIKFKSKITGEDITKDAFFKEIYRSINDEIRQKIHETIEKYKSSKLNISVEVEIGYPPDNILKKMQRGNFDLEILGTKGLKGISKLTGLGSIARKISESSSCNFLLVH